MNTAASTTLTPAQRAPRPALRVRPTTTTTDLALAPAPLPAESDGADYSAAVTAARVAVLAFTASVLRRMASPADALTVPACAALADQLTTLATALAA